MSPRTLTFASLARAQVGHDPREDANNRTKRLNLDTIYRGGPREFPLPYVIPSDRMQPREYLRLAPSGRHAEEAGQSLLEAMP